jgi:hypothetical protein
VAARMGRWEKLSLSDKKAYWPATVSNISRDPLYPWIGLKWPAGKFNTLGRVINVGYDRIWIKFPNEIRESIKNSTIEWTKNFNLIRYEDFEELRNNNRPFIAWFNRAKQLKDAVIVNGTQREWVVWKYTSFEKWLVNMWPRNGRIGTSDCLRWPKKSWYRKKLKLWRCWRKKWRLVI